ncbi:MAG: YhjD/YihY/BrkB family envelope integrity protein, partial [Janibacter sp.]
LPGAVMAALAWQAMQHVGAAYVSTVVERASNLNSVFALVLGLLIFLYTMAVIVMLCVEVNVVLKERLWPRALLSPFTDQVVLTAADERAYARHAEAQRLKGFQRIDVFFEDSRGRD